METKDLIYQIFVDQENKLTIALDKSDEIEIDQMRFDQAILDTKRRLGVKLHQGVCSQLLIEQIARHRLNIGEIFNEKIEFYNASEIIDMIELLENDKLNSKSFDREILKGFSKIHHGTYSSIGYSVARNIKEYWFKKGMIRKERQSEFQNILYKFEDYGLAAVANTMHTKAMMSKELKGEWVIFVEKNGRKYYLCLASHKEKDDFIYENKIKRCLIEFPELKSI